MFRVLFVLLVLVVVGPIGMAVGQTPEAPPKTTDALPQLSEKEVLAVQRALFQRGVLETQPSGVFDGQTREALQQFQRQEGLTETGRIDQPTIEKLGLVFPITTESHDSDRRNGVLPRIGYAIKDETKAATKAVGGVAKKVGSGAKAGAQVTAETSGAAVNKTGETAKVAGDKTVDGAKSVGRGVQKASNEVAEVTVGRSDESIHRDVRALIDRHVETRSLVSEVKDGRVTLITAAKAETDLSAVITQMRKISGVRSVMVISQ